jgi:hypothetical protein
LPRSNSAADWSRLMFDASRLWADAGKFGGLLKLG